MVKVTCGYCGCDTGVAGFTSIQRRLDDSLTPIWREGGCQHVRCICHIKPNFADIHVDVILALRVTIL